MMQPRTWPQDWEQRVAGDECPFCAQGRPEDNGFGIRIQATDLVDTYLQRGGVTPGYAIAIWRGSHITEVSDLPAVQASDYWRDVMDVGRALRNFHGACKVNYQTLGNIEPHLHTHIQCRFLDDPCPEAPLTGDKTQWPEETLLGEASALRQLLRGDEAAT